MMRKSANVSFSNCLASAVVVAPPTTWSLMASTLQKLASSSFEPRHTTSFELPSADFSRDVTSPIVLSSRASFTFKATDTPQGWCFFHLTATPLCEGVADHLAEALTSSKTPREGVGRTIHRGDGVFTEVKQVSTTPTGPMTKRFFLLAPIAAAALALNPITPLMTQVQAAEKAGYEFITDADDGTLYFGKQLGQVDDQVVVEFKVINDPQETEDYEFVSAFDCRERLYKDVDGGWLRADPDTVGIEWMDFACGVGGN